MRNLFNPAFCGLLTHRALKGYEEVEPYGMPFSLSLLVLPLALHGDTRKELQSHPRTRLLSILEQSHLTLGFDERARSILPLAHEGFTLLALRHCIEVSEDGKLKTVARRMRSVIGETEETQDCLDAAKRIGKEFARIGDRATIYTALGVRP
ncbi:three component ABC system middle component [Brevibacterium zhoupengii]|uniref:three component ABC system middle component n=1 Tax=Brevibacterium zhoupengii TaxID=2898795 RepID=UPI003B8A8849